MSGSSNAITHLVCAMIAQAPPTMRFVLVRYRDQRLPAEIGGLQAVHVPKMPLPAELLWNELRLPRLLKDVRADLYHGMKQCGPFRLHCPQVHTVDAIKRGSADELPLPLGPRVYNGWYVCGRYKRSAHLMPVSGYVGGFLTDSLGIETQRLTVVNNGVGEMFHDAGRSDADNGHDPLNLGVPYLINVGSVIPLKNQLAAVEALARIAEKVPHHLVILGREDKTYGPRVRAAAEQAGIGHRLHLVGFVDARGLVGYLLGAQAMVHPTRTEGFGLATAEAMACGLPLVVSDRGGLREQCGDAAVYLDDPDDHDALAAALLRVLGDAGLRETMRRRGLRRAGALTWPQAARKTLEVYDRLLNSA
jgi:glycosyltransferase involved in cell wall biosynthesis